VSGFPYRDVRKSPVPSASFRESPSRVRLSPDPGGLAKRAHLKRASPQPIPRRQLMDADAIQLPVTDDRAAPTERELFAKLSHREQEVLRLTGQGYSAPEIGRRLSISPKTVDTYKQRISEKAHLSHRSEYVQFA